MMLKVREILIGSIFPCLFACNMIDFSAVPKSVTIKNLESRIKQKIVVYGTSLTFGGAWVEQLGTILHHEFSGNVSVINSGRNGANSDWGLQNVEDSVVSKHPDCVFIEFSINDAVSNTITEDISKKKLNCIIDIILDNYSECEIVLMTMNPRTDGYVTPTRMASYYQVYREVAADRHCIIVDNYPLWVDIQSRDMGLYNQYIPDGCHPTAQGCEAVTTPNILKVLGIFDYNNIN
jgi:acyl-CoA thioesterase I